MLRVDMMMMMMMMMMIQKFCYLRSSVFVIFEFAFLCLICQRGESKSRDSLNTNAKKDRNRKKGVNFSLACDLRSSHTAFHLTIISLEKLILCRTQKYKQTNKQLLIFLRAYQNDRHLVAARLHFYDPGISRKQARTVRG